MSPDPVVSEEALPGRRLPPLTGIRVLDLSRVLAGPYATMILGDLGAEVIKVERPGRGDDTREWGPPFVGPEGRQESTYFLSANRNKRSIELDLKDRSDIELLHRMVAWADVLVENFRPGVMERLGLTAELLEKINPRLVLLTISGFGTSGPDRDRVAYDQILQGEGGLMSLTGEAPERPLRVGVPVADLTAGMYGVIGVLAALHERHHSGLGQRVETSLLAGQVAIHSFQGTRYLVAGEVPRSSGNQHPTVTPYGAFQAADGQLILAVGNERTWRRFADLLGIPAETGPYVGNHNRVAHREELHKLIEERLGERDVAEWVALFGAHGIPVGEVKTLEKVYASDQVRDQGLVVETTHSTLGKISLSGPPLRFGGSPLQAPAAPPTLGEHSANLRARFASGHSADEESAAESVAGSRASASNAVRDLMDAFEPLKNQALAGDPLQWPGYPEQLESARRRTGDEQSVTAGHAWIGGKPCVVVAFNFAFIGGSMGEAEGERIAAATRLAVTERLPLVTVIRSGGARMQEGMRSLIQLPITASYLARLGAEGIPHISVAREPTTGGVWAAIGAGADLILAEEGAAIAFAGSRIREDRDEKNELFKAEGKFSHGFVDAVLPAAKLRERLALAIELLAPDSRGELAPAPLPESRSNGAPRSGWNQVEHARRAGKPSGDDYLQDYFTDVLEIRGDRVGGVDEGVKCGFGRRDGRTVAFVSQSGDYTSAAGYRTATRLVKLADKLRLPVLTLIDSPGADGSAAGEATGVGGAIAMLLQAIAEATVPILSVTIGQGGSGGSLALAAPQNLWITSDGYFSVTNPEAAAAILKRAPEEVPSVADQLRLGPEDLQKLDVVRGVLG